MRVLIQRPGYRNDGKYQFVVGYTGGFCAEMCVHLSFEEVSKRAEEKIGKGTLIDDGVDLWWETEQKEVPLKKRTRFPELKLIHNV